MFGISNQFIDRPNELTFLYTVGIIIQLGGYDVPEVFNPLLPFNFCPVQGSKPIDAKRVIKNISNGFLSIESQLNNLAKLEQKLSID
jgi:hypothetical protein